MSIADWLGDRTAVGTSAWKPAQNNPLIDMMTGAGPAQTAYDQMFGGDGADGGGMGSGVSSGTSPGTTMGSKAGTWGAQPSFETGRTVRNIGRVVGTLAPGVFGTLAGTAIGMAGTMADLEEVNAHLTARGFPTIDPAKAAVSSLAPFGLAGNWSPEGQYNAMQGFGLGPAVEYDDMVQGAQYGNWGPIGSMGFDDSYGDAFGGWGGYGGMANQGPGADYESDPDSAAADAAADAADQAAADQAGADMDDEHGGNDDDDEDY